MYSRRISQSIVTPPPNLKGCIRENTKKFSYTKFSLMLRQKYNSLRNVKEVNKKIQNFIRNGKIYKMFTEAQSIRNQRSVLRLWAHHCECVFAQRLRRYQQMFFLYSKLWEERAFKEFVRKMRQSLTRKGKELALGAVGISAFNWDENRIPDEEFRPHAKELEYVSELKNNTICLSCDSARTNINTTVCKCGTSGKLPTTSYDNWTPFIEKNDLIVWRRLHPSGQYEYKVYGSYSEISAEDFLNVQIDIDYRRKWDTTAVLLEIAETDQTPNSNSDIIYWEMLWPRLFVNRDYVYNRRYMVDKESNTIFILSKSTEHPNFPKYPEKYRIHDYWSCMVIKPYTDMKQPGLEFSLTYFDNPGVNIPSSVTNWVSMRVMPDFLERLRQASRNYRAYCKAEGLSQACRIIVEEERAAEEKRQREKLDYCIFKRIQDRLVATHPNADKEDNKTKSERRGLNSGNVVSKDDNVSSEIGTVPSSGAVKTHNDSFWKYFHPLYYFQ